MEKKKLPIYELEDDIVKYLQPSNRDRLIIEAPTGSGKSTQLPQILINNNVVKSGGIVVLQPLVYSKLPHQMYTLVFYT